MLTTLGGGGSTTRNNSQNRGSSNTATSNSSQRNSALVSKIRLRDVSFFQTLLDRFIFSKFARVLFLEFLPVTGALAGL